MPNDNHHHITPPHTSHYPEPDIPVDEAWQQMKKLLPASPAAGPAGAQASALPAKALLYGLPGLAAVTVMAWYLLTHKPNALPPNTGAVYTTQSAPRQDTLAGGLVLYLDRHSTISAAPGNGNALMISVRGAVYIQAAQARLPALHVTAGSVEVIPSQANVYIAFDTAATVSLVQVQSGQALVKAGNAAITVTAGQSARYDEKTKRLEQKHKSDINTFSYATRSFEFINTPLQEAAGQLEKAYGISILFSNQALYHCRITTSFDNKPLREVLDIMAYTLNFEYTLDSKNNQVILKGYGCR